MMHCRMGYNTMYKSFFSIFFGCMHIKSLCCIMAPPRQGTDISLPLSPPNICSQPMKQSCTMLTSKLLDFAFLNKLWSENLRQTAAKAVVKLRPGSKAVPKNNAAVKRMEWTSYSIRVWPSYFGRVVLDVLILEVFIFSSRRLKHFFLQRIDEPNILEG